MLQSRLPLRPRPRRKPKGRAGATRPRRTDCQQTLADRAADLDQAHDHARRARALLRHAGAPQSYRRAHSLCKSIDGARRHLLSMVYRELAAATRALAGPPAPLGSPGSVRNVIDPGPPAPETPGEPRRGPPCRAALRLRSSRSSQVWG
jgi:hypothetical protein